MAERNFMQLLRAKFAENKFVCVGLDSDLSKIPDFCKKSDSSAKRYDPAWHIFYFNQQIIYQTHDLVCAYKPNIAFYEAHGEVGIKALKQTIDYLHENHPDIPVILDAKRADIGNTNKGYAQMAFDFLRADAITINPYFGQEAMQVFLDYQDKGFFVLCKTSNPGAGEFQDLVCEGEPLYLHVAQAVAQSWNQHGNCGLVVGATYPEDLGKVRELVGNMPILIPGIGKQGGDLEASVVFGQTVNNEGFIINSSSGIIFASSGDDFAIAARRETRKLHFQILMARNLKETEALARSILGQAEAVLNNSHFVYTSGKHGSAYVDKNMVTRNTEFIARLCSMIAEEFSDYGVDAVVGPATAGIVLSQWTASALDEYYVRSVQALYADQTSDKKFELKRGYDKAVKGKRVLVVEDIMTTGDSARSTIEAVRVAGGEVIGLAVLCNRGGLTSESMDVPKLFSLVTLPLDSYLADDCPLCQTEVPINTTVGHGKEFLARKS